MITKNSIEYKTLNFLCKNGIVRGMTNILRASGCTLYGLLQRTLKDLGYIKDDKWIVDKLKIEDVRKLYKKLNCSFKAVKDRETSLDRLSVFLLSLNNNIPDDMHKTLEKCNVPYRNCLISIMYNNCYLTSSRGCGSGLTFNLIRELTIEDVKHIKDLCKNYTIDNTKKNSQKYGRSKSYK